MKDKITKSEVNTLIDKHGFDMDTIKANFDIENESKPRCYTFNVEKERQYAIKVLNVISNLTQKERDRVLSRALKLNKM